MQAPPAQEVVEAVEQAFREEPRLGSRFHLDRVYVEDDGALVLEGEVARLAEKKLVLLRAAAVPGVTKIVDRVHLAAAEPVRHLRSQLGEVFAQESDFLGFEVREDVAEGPLAVEFVPVAGEEASARGRIDIEENDAVVTLNGSVPSLVHKRLAGALAWRVPGVRDVVNGIIVDPPEEDGPDEMEEAVRVVLDQNRSVDASQIKVGVRGRVVRLTGLARSQAERQAAEDDAWAVFGVDEVLDEIEVAS